MRLKEFFKELTFKVGDSDPDRPTQIRYRIRGELQLEGEFRAELQLTELRQLAS